MQPLNDVETITPETNQPETRNKSKLDNIKNTVADKLQGAASAVRQKAGQQEGAVGDYAGKASSWLEDAAGYIRQMNPQQIKSDVQDEVRRNPGRALLIAGAAGLLLGVLIRR
ncbi:MAG TPA: DUF883 C-terminal domain-containing protein [Blastocatellia bacterium]|nr:DUF883 C-terminal domain-containing protein [Blastocatellia bacterium]